MSIPPAIINDIPEIINDIPVIINDIPVSDTHANGICGEYSLIYL